LSIFFLTPEEVLAIHDDQITRYGGDTGLRDLGLLQSALAVPCATFDGEFLHSDLAEMAAAYLFHLVGNHPFIDGNKRVGAVAAIVFLDLNGVNFNAPESEFEQVTMSVACGEIEKTGVADFFHRHQPNK
jgi:death on curing protein